MHYTLLCCAIGTQMAIHGIVIQSLQIKYMLSCRVIVEATELFSKYTKHTKDGV